MYTINFDPVIFGLFGLQIRWYSLSYILGALFLYYFMHKAVKRGLVPGLDYEGVEDFVLYIVLGVVLGARVGFFLFYDFFQLFSLELFKVWHGGMSFHGGVLGVVLATWLFVRKRKIKFWALADVAVVPITFGLVLGRMANFVNGELAGTLFDGAWCVVFPLYDNLCRHPYPMYALISHLILFVVLFAVLVRSYKAVGSGRLSAYFLIGYGVLRMFVDIFKIDNVVWFLKTGQWLSLVMIIVGVWLYYRKKNQ